MSNLAIIYASLIIDGYKTYAQVPAKIKPQVKEALTALGHPELAVEETADKEEKTK